MLNNVPLEIKLMQMSFPQMLDAIEAFEELDQYLMDRLDEISDPNEVTRILEQVSKRRRDREKFINLRLAIEFDGVSTLHS